ncbi:MAG TPA: hypothetical protein VM734_01560 [Kofleriaceae bacterium]|jgi:hypothetical protein|nr:hypothetical protein [Kofleriaceae bacterium]
MDLRLCSAVAVLLAACSSAAPERVERHRCVVFEGVSRTIPPGGVAVTLDLPASWRPTEYADGSCTFRHATERGMVSVNLDFCIEVRPCDEGLPPAGARLTRDLRLGDQVMRTTETRRADPRSHRVVTCSATVQATSITADLDRQRERLAAWCDRLAFAP